jgi:hypothetical protein
LEPGNELEEKRVMARICTIITRTLFPAALAATALSWQAASAGIVKDMPDAIICSVKDPTGRLPWEKLVYYVSAYMVNGNTLYKTLTSDPVVLLVSADGIIDGANLADCDGRSVDSLRAEGRAFTLATRSREAAEEL